MYDRAPHLCLSEELTDLQCNHLNCQETGSLNLALLSHTTIL